MFYQFCRLRAFAAIPPLTKDHWMILGLVAFATLWGAYDMALLQLALPQIADDLSIPFAQMSNVGALIKLGAVPAVGFTLIADRWGRRWLFIGSILGFTMATGATAFVTTSSALVLCQFFMRIFVTVAMILAGVYIVEEFPAAARGWGMGAYTGLSTVGGGLAALLFAGIQILPFGWRGLYLIGLLALLFLPLWLWYLPETRRFQEQHRAQGEYAPAVPHLQPLTQLFQAYPERLFLLGLVVLCFNVGGDSALFYDPTYLQEAHQWQPYHVSLLNLSAGFMALLGSIVAGRLSDTIGRNRTALYLFSALPLFIIGYYNASGWWLPIFWAGFLFCSIGTTVILSATGNELFPTGYRATASGVTVILATLSGSLSLGIHGQLVRWDFSPWFAISLLALVLLITPLFFLRLPETSGRALEEIAPETVER